MTVPGIDALIMEQEGLSRRPTREDIQGVQLRKLNALLAREKERGGYYKDLPERVESLEALAALPFTTDEELAAHGGSLLLLSQSEVLRVLSDATSGTTGRAKRVFYTEGDCENTVRLFMAGLAELVYPGSTTMICMPFSGPFGLGELISEAIERLGARPLRLGAELSYGELSAVLDGEKPDTYVGMPARLLSLLRFCGRGSLRRALISGDACPRSITKVCESMLASRLFPHYGSRELGLGGAICCRAHQGMHLRENHVIAEIVGDRGEVLPRGEYGELVISTIGMQAMPLIRYRTGDYTRFLPLPCPCGSVALRIEAVSRRGGETILALDEGMFAVPELVDYKAALADSVLTLEALTLGGAGESELRAAAMKALPQYEARIRLRPAAPEDRPLYTGKRHIL